LGLLGAITSRGEAQVVRLALIYALLDISLEIKITHLEAALAVWKYCEDSAKYIFGEKFGNDTIDTIFQHFSDNKMVGITSTALHKLFGNNKPASEIERALSELLKCGKIRMRKESGIGRPTLIYEFNELIMANATDLFR